MASLQSPLQPKLVFLLLVAVLCRHTSYAFVFPSHLTASLGSGGPSQLLPALKPATLPSAPVAHPLPSLHYLDLNRREDTKDHLPVLVLHGLLGSSRNFRGWANTL
ncbi:hypothetical protein NGA_0680800, partial [Nannochloropsis gaditana CCMP526]|uniref:uncharacterized protein n=1 Tax=Nannochloropsis gaditana (strain CCMP526) TaxID=1093141 RepID=UPI00029F6238